MIATISAILPLAALFQFSDGLSAVGGGILRGCGRQEVGAYINLAGYYAIALPLAAALAFHYHYGLVGLWTGLALGLFIVSLIQVILIARTDWREESRKALALVQAHGACYLEGVQARLLEEGQAIPVSPLLPPMEREAVGAGRLGAATRQE